MSADLEVARMIEISRLEKSRTVLRASLGNLAEKQSALRSALESERAAKDALDAALVDAEWELAGCFEVRSNKTWLVADAKGIAIPDEAQRSLTADEKKAWIAAKARQLPEVAAAAGRLRAAEHDVAGRRDELDIAEKSLRASRADLDAAIAYLNALVAVYPSRNGAS